MKRVAAECNTRQDSRSIRVRRFKPRGHMYQGPKAVGGVARNVAPWGSGRQNPGRADTGRAPPVGPDQPSGVVPEGAGHARRCPGLQPRPQSGFGKAGRVAGDLLRRERVAVRRDPRPGCRAARPPKGSPGPHSPDLFRSGRQAGGRTQGPVAPIRGGGGVLALRAFRDGGRDHQRLGRGVVRGRVGSGRAGDHHRVVGPAVREPEPEEPGHHEPTEGGGRCDPP